MRPVFFGQPWLGVTTCDNHAAARQVNKDYKKLKALLAQAARHGSHGTTF